MTRDPKSVPQVKPMSVEPLDAGIEMHLIAAGLLRMVDQPRQQTLTVSARSLSVIRDQVIDIQEPSPREVFEQPKASDRDHAIAGGEVSEAETGPLLTPHAGDGICGVGQVRPQLPQHGQTGSDLFVRFGERHSRPVHEMLSNRSQRLGTVGISEMRWSGTSAV